MPLCPQFRVIQSSYAVLLRQCQVLQTAKTLHSKIQADGFQADTFLANLVVQTYSRCGSIQQALSTFHSIPDKNLFSYAIAITALDNHGHFRQAIDLYNSMDTNLVPDDVTTIAALTACSKIGDLVAARALHEQIVDREACLGIKVYNSMITMYSKCGSSQDAKNVFDRAPQKNLVSWNAMISAFARSGQARDAIKLLWKMENEGEKPDRYTFCSILTVCSSEISGALHCPWRLATGKMIHDRVVALDLETDVGVGTCLTNFYARSGQLEEARRHFDKTVDKNIVSWNAMLAAYSTAGKLPDLLEVYRNMEVEPDSATYCIVLAACAAGGDLEHGQQVYEKLKDGGGGGEGIDPIVQAAVLNLYAKCGDLEEATRIFSSCCYSSNTAAWNTLIAAHVHSGNPGGAAGLYKRLIQTPGAAKPDAFTFSTVLAAVASLGAIDETATIHGQIIAAGFSSNEFVLKALLNTYAKCGNLDEATKIFQSIQSPDTILWTSMILGYAQHGQVLQSLELFRGLILQGLSPDYVTCTSVLHACGHQGLLRETMEILRWEEVDYGIQRTLEHYHCVIDMLARLGLLEEAEELCNAVSDEGDGVAWISMLSGLRTQMDENFQQQWLMCENSLYAAAPPHHCYRANP